MSVSMMSRSETFNRIINKEELFILDVRNAEEFSEWKIEGENIQHYNKPYFELLESVDGILDKLPKDKAILVVCAKEGSSKMIARKLSEKGLDVYYLEGGMKEWSEYLHPVKVGDLKEGGSVYQFVRIGKGCLSYLVESEGEGVVIDAVRTIDAFKDFAKENNIEIKHVLDTHLHADHISGGRHLAKDVGATYWLPPKDATEVTFNYEELNEEKEIKIGSKNIKIEPIYSPGHTIGSTSFNINDEYLMTGDILFVESIGRPDLAGKAEDWVSDLRNTLYSLYKKLPNDLIVLPAHFGKVSELDNKGRVMESLGELYKVNLGLNINSEEDFRKTVTENLPPQPNSYKEIRQVNMGKIEPDVDEQREMEIGPNRCAIHD